MINTDTVGQFCILAINFMSQCLVLIARKRLNVYRYTIESNIDNVIVFIIRSSRDVSTVPKTFSGVLLTTRQVLVTRQGNIGQVIPHLMVYLASKNSCGTIVKKKKVILILYF